MNEKSSMDEVMSGMSPKLTSVPESQECELETIEGGLGRPQHSHHRNISWGKTEFFNGDGTAASFNPSIGSPEGPTLRQSSAERSDFSVSTMGEGELPDLPRPTRRESSSTSVLLADLNQHSPFETEAESYIMKVLEARDPTVTTRARAESTGASTIFSSLPDQAVDNFAVPPGGESSSSLQSTAVSSRPSWQQSSSVRSELGHRRAASTTLPHHERHRSMEVRLFDLTTAIDAVHQNNIFADVFDDDGMKEEPISSADALQQNANLLFRRGVDTNNNNNTTEFVDESNHSKIATPQSRIHMEELPHPKKDDDVDGDETSATLDGGLYVNRKDYGLGLSDIFTPHRRQTVRFIKYGTYTIVLFLGVAVILYYLAGNPPTGILRRPVNGTYADLPLDANAQASTSWWLLFVLRLLVLGAAAKLTELLLIDVLLIQCGKRMQCIGPWPSLFLLQARGWPFLLFMWSIYCWALLSGNGPFFRHWLFFQDFIGLFNGSNPHGTYIGSTNHKTVLTLATVVPIIVAIKRFWLGLHMGKQTYAQFSEKLESIMRKILLISEVATLGRDFERHVNAHSREIKPLPPLSKFGMDEDGLQGLIYSAEDASNAASSANNKSMNTSDVNDDCVIDPRDRHPLTGSLSSSQKYKIAQLLGAWEEPVVAETQLGPISVNSLLHFRRALACLNNPYPFSGSFGRANTRESCIESTQEVYRRLTLRSPSRVLLFDVLALLAVRRDKSIDQHKLKDLIRLFRPERDGSLRAVEFVKSVDCVYKELRTLRAAVANSSKIDQAFENIFNVVFYAIILTGILSTLGLNPLAIFLSVSGVILAFAFMIGSASSKYFEGLLFILVRRPYTIGSCIHVSNIEEEPTYTGHPFWIVEDVTLFTTTVVYMYTNEKATLSNGSLANSRIINASRSPAAAMFIMLKFPVDVTLEKLKIFQAAIEEFVRNRPREWASLDAFRATSVEAHLGYIDYLVAVTHRSGWSEWPTIQLSKADLIHFSMELAKKLDIWYKAPPMPINLSYTATAAMQNAVLPNSLQQQQSHQLGAPVSIPSATEINGLHAMFPPRGL